MKILYLGTDLFSKGGIPRYSRYQLTALREAYGPSSVTVMSLSPMGPDSLEEPLETDWIGGGLSAIHRLRYFVRALRYARERRPDLVLATHVSVAPLAVLAARLAGGRSMLNVYGLEMWSGFRRRDRMGLEHIDHILSDCHFTARYVNGELGVARNRTDVVWDCVDLDRFTPGPPQAEVAERYGVPLHAHELRVMTLGRVTRLSRHKGYERMVEVVAELSSRIPVRYVVAGTGDLVDDLRSAARARNVEDRVTFAGSIHERDLAAIYRCCDVFCLISDRGHGRGEGIPLTPLEAAACGIPILVGNQDGSQEAVLDGENGFVVDPFDIAGIAKRIELLHQRQELRRQMGLAARKRVEAEHSFPTFKERTIAAFARAQGGPVPLGGPHGR